MRERDYLFDNIKFFLIFLVVFAHLLEPKLGDSTVKAAYNVIYSFHMPVFIFVMGYFAKFNPAKILKSIVLPYVLGRPDEALGGGNQGPSAPGWARQHHSQRDPPFGRPGYSRAPPSTRPGRTRSTRT